MMLDGRSDQMPALGLERSGGAEDGQIDAFGPAAGENDLARFAVKNGGDTVTSVIKYGPRLPPHMMHARGVAKHRPQIPQHRLPHLGIQRRGRVVIEINCAHPEVAAADVSWL